MMSKVHPSSLGFAEARSPKPRATILVCFALKEEAAPFQKMAAGTTVAAAQAASVLITSIGRKNAERSVREFLTINSPKLILTCGFAGGLNPDLKLGEVVFELTDRRGELHEPQTENESGARSARPSESSSLREKLLVAGAKPVKFFCADRVVTTTVEKKKLRTETGADAVEMESAAIHAVCRERGIPCATVRVISDIASEDLPLDFNQLSKPDWSLNYGKLALIIAKSPGKIGALMRLQKRCRFAAERLADVLSKIL
jgi:adenosylhomocysteine nucleosidase